MTARVLPPDEWGRLAETPLGEVVSHLSGSAQILVVEDAGEIVGQWVALPVWHVEGLWIAPEKRGTPGVARRLWMGMQRVLRQAGVSAVITGAESDTVRALLRHAGAERLPFESYRLPIGR